MKGLVRFFKIIIISIILLVMVLYIVWSLIFLFPIGNKLAEGVNQKNILALKIGMNEHNIIKILGSPLVKEVELINNNKYITLIYGISGLLGAGTEVEVILKDGKTNLIILEFLDASFYYCSEDICPGIGEPFWFNWYIPK